MSTISKEWTSRPIRLAEHNVCRLIFVKVKYFPIMWLIMWNIPLIYKLTSRYHCGCIYILYKIHEQCSVCKPIKMKTEKVFLVTRWGFPSDAESKHTRLLMSTESWGHESCSDGCVLHLQGHCRPGEVQDHHHGLLPRCHGKRSPPPPP